MTSVNCSATWISAAITVWTSIDTHSLEVEDDFPESHSQMKMNL